MANRQIHDIMIFKGMPIGHCLSMCLILGHKKTNDYEMTKGLCKKSELVCGNNSTYCFIKN